MPSRFSGVWLFATPWTVAHQAPLSMGFSRQECWSGLPCPPPGALPNPGIKPRSPALQADSLSSEPLPRPGILEPHRWDSCPTSTTCWLFSHGWDRWSLLTLVNPSEKRGWELYLPPSIIVRMKCVKCFVPHLVEWDELADLNLLLKVTVLSHVWLFATPWTVAYQAPLSMRFSRQEYWNGLPFPSPGDLPDSGIEPWSPALQADALTSEPPGKT